MPSLQPTDVPRRASLQIATLADGRLLLRGPAGVSLLGGVAGADVERVLAEVDGERTAEEICRRLVGEYEERDVLRLLRHLAGASAIGGAATLQNRSEAAPPGLDSRLMLAADGVLADRLGEILGVAGSPAGSELESSDLVICALEDAPYEELFELQRACLRAGVASLWLTVDPDGVRIGPATVPGVGPCFACAQIASFRALRLPAPELVAAAAGYRSGTVGRRHLESAAGQAVREVRALLTAGGRPELLASVRLLSASGIRTYAVSPVSDCPLCGAASERDHPLAASARRELVDSYRRAPRRSSASMASAAADDELCTSVGIVGGGTAGYLTALALRRKVPGLKVTLIESSAVPVIGVGEATTPLMPQFLHVDLGLDAGELFREVQPTLKLGIRFEWGEPEGSFNYPFGPVHLLEPAVYDRDLERCSPQSLLMSAGNLPLSEENGAWRSDLGVDAAYHLDNRRFVRYLRRRAGELGIEAIDALIAGVEVADDGETVTALVADDGRRFAFDLYVDCSGFRSLLLEQALGSPFRSYADSLPTDRALIASVSHGGVVAPYTLAETMSAGWCWSTPQRDADHRGYVFCSAFCEPEDAEREMRRANPGMGEARLIRFRAGRHEHFWRGNVVALGNAYGFVEPLESTALHMLIRQIGLLAGAFPLTRGERGIAERGVAGLLNRRVGAWWDYLRWFLALHYRYNRRLDTPFWRHCRRQADVSGHAELIALFEERGPLSYQSLSLDGHAVPDPLWGAEGIDLLLLGQGVPCRLSRPATRQAEWRARARLYQQHAERAIPQARALELLDRHPELLESWIADFERVGPAFG